MFIVHYNRNKPREISTHLSTRVPMYPPNKTVIRLSARPYIVINTRDVDHIYTNAIATANSKARVPHVDKKCAIQRYVVNELY